MTEETIQGLRKIVMSALQMLSWTTHEMYHSKYVVRDEKLAVKKIRNFVDGILQRKYGKRPNWSDVKAKSAEQTIEEQYIEDSTAFTFDMLLLCECVHSGARAEVRKRFEKIVIEENEKLV